MKTEIMEIIIMEQIDGRRGVTIEGDAGDKFRAALESFKAAIPEGARSYKKQMRTWSVAPAAWPQLEEWAAGYARKRGVRIERRDLRDPEQFIDKLLDSFGGG